MARPLRRGEVGGSATLLVEQCREHGKFRKRQTRVLLTIPDQVDRDIAEAIRSKDKARLNALRLIKAALCNEAIAERGPLSDGSVSRVLARLASQSNESIRHFERNGRPDLVARELEDLRIIESYMPPPPAESNGSDSASDGGDLLSAVMARVSGHSEGTGAAHHGRREVGEDGVGYCPNCESQYNAALVQFHCRMCRYPFFNRPLDENESAPQPTERILELFEACEHVANRNWTNAEFIEYLSDSFIPKLQEKEAAIRNFEIPFGLEQDFAIEFEVGTRGVDQCNEALGHLLSYDAEAPNGNDILLEGLDLFFRGINSVKHAMRINRENRDRPLWI